MGDAYPVRMQLQIVQICGVQTAQPVYVKFMWRGEKQKTPLLRPLRQPRPVHELQRQQVEAEFLLPYDPAVDGEALLLRLWAPAASFVPLPALGPQAGMHVHRMQVQRLMEEQRELAARREEQQRHEQQLALNDMLQHGTPENQLQQHLHEQELQQQMQQMQQYYPQSQQQQHPQQQYYYPQQQQQLLQPSPHQQMQQPQQPPQQPQQQMQQQLYQAQQQQYYEQQQAAYIAHQQQLLQQQGRLPGGAPSSSSREQAPPQQSDEAYIHSILPHATSEQIRAALAQSNGDREMAVDLLLRQAVDAAAAGHQQEVQQQQQQAAAGAAAAAAGQGPSSAPYNAAIPPVQPQGPSYPQGAPPPSASPMAGGPPQGPPQQQQQQALLPASALHQPSPVPQHPGVRKALLIGINYTGSRAQLRGCINDAKRMQQLLRGLFGFGGGPTDMVVLTDDNPDPLYHPTRKNICSAMRWLTLGNAAGDALFFHYSGHGARRPDPSGIESDGFDEVILPVDFERAGEIVDDELHEYLVQPLQSGCRLTAVMDSCHSGSGLDLPFVWSQEEFKWREETNPFYVLGDVQLFSGCEDTQTSADLRGEGLQRAAGGAMTTAFVSALTQMPFSHSYPSLMDALSASMKQRNLQQRPQLTSSQRFDFNRPFSLTAAIPNSNASLGRRIRRLRKPPQTGRGGAPSQALHQLLLRLPCGATAANAAAAAANGAAAKAEAAYVASNSTAAAVDRAATEAEQQQHQQTEQQQQQTEQQQQQQQQQVTEQQQQQTLQQQQQQEQQQRQQQEQ
ncbi:hypothetical protein Efla_002765 [Eimeria flavescens]